MFTSHHLSHVRCQVSGVRCIFFADKVMDLVGGGSVINEAYPIQFQESLVWLLHKCIFHLVNCPKSTLYLFDRTKIARQRKTYSPTVISLVLSHLVNCPQSILYLFHNKALSPPSQPFHPFLSSCSLAMRSHKQDPQFYQYQYQITCFNTTLSLQSSSERTQLVLSEQRASLL